MGRCERERRIEVIVKIKKKSGEWRQVRMDVNVELKFCKQKWGGGGGQVVGSKGGCE